jgi:hypothetical protein
MFESAKLKVDRAKQHIRNLRTTLNSYSQSARLEFGPEGSFITVTIDSGAEPTCSLIIGDAVHNLRAALEHAFWELMEIGRRCTRPPDELSGLPWVQNRLRGLLQRNKNTQRRHEGIVHQDRSIPRWCR